MNLKLLSASASPRARPATRLQARALRVHMPLTLIVKFRFTVSFHDRAAWSAAQAPLRHETVRCARHEEGPTRRCPTLTISPYGGPHPVAPPCVLSSSPALVRSCLPDARRARPRNRFHRRKPPCDRP